MPDYQQGKIYKLCGAGKIYIGSTTISLAKRHYYHKKQGHSTVQEIIADPNNQITLIELVACSSKEELLAKERYHIENTECVNKRIPILSEFERKEYQKEYMKVYYQDPEIKTHIKEYQTEYRKNSQVFKEYRNEYKQSPIRKAYQKAYNDSRKQSSEYKAYQKEYRESKKAKKLIEKLNPNTVNN
jgi:hypothetical protein